MIDTYQLYFASSYFLRNIYLVCYGSEVIIDGPTVLNIWENLLATLVSVQVSGVMVGTCEIVDLN